MKTLRILKTDRAWTLCLSGMISGIILYGCSSTPHRAAVRIPSTVPVTVYGQSNSAALHNVYHVVGPSETLWRISKTYDVDMQTLMSVNHLDDPTKIKSGQKLTIPNVQGAKPIIPLYPNSRWTHIVIHHTATHEGNAFTIDQIHHRRGFWNGLGYHFLINNGTDGKEDGQIEVGPRWVKQMQGAHANAAGMNEHGIGISLVGNFSERRVSRAELNALVFLVKTLQQYYKIPFINVIRHGDVPGKNTECPGNNFPWAEFKELIDR